MGVLLQATHARVDLARRHLHDAERVRLAVRELVHRLLGDVEPGPGVVDREHVDRRLVVRQLPARATVGRVPSYCKQQNLVSKRIKSTECPRAGGRRVVPAMACAPPM